jgi:hypothetical protein
MSGPLGSFFQCYENPANTIRAVLSFRKAYPTGTVVLVNDGGRFDYSRFCSDQGIVYRLYEHAPTANTNGLYGVECVTAFLERMWEAWPCFTESSIMLLEDDVRVLRPFRQTFPFSINGENRGVAQDPKLMKDLLQAGIVDPPQHYGGFGGCILDRIFFQQIPLADVLKSLRALAPLMEYASDLILTWIAIRWGGTLGPHPELAEAWYTDILERLVNDRVAVLHQYKSEYGSALTQDEIRWFQTTA